MMMRMIDDEDDEEEEDDEDEDDDDDDDDDDHPWILMTIHPYIFSLWNSVLYVWTHGATGDDEPGPSGEAAGVLKFRCLTNKKIEK